MDETRAEPPEVEAPPLAIVPGDRFVDEPEEYAVEHQIGAGGMGTVVAAKGSKLGRPVALKVITAGNEELRLRFEREAQVTARLQHPSIVPVYGAGRRSGRPFYAMKHVTGEPLDRVIAGATTLARRLALLPKVIAVTEAIAYAHAERVIHRDLKPANILVGAFGETVVIDWGLAKDLRAPDDAATTVSPYRASPDETRHGRVMGTPAYMPLEQARGEPVDERADVYALGAILYHVLDGAPPYRRADEGSVPWETMVARVLAGPPDPLDATVLPPDLVAIVTRAMARDARERYASAGELAEDLRRFQTGQLVGAHRYSTWQLVRRWARRHRGVLSVGAILGALLIAVGVASIWKILDERDAAESARTLAESRRVESDGRRRAAEKLVEYVVNRLHDRLEPIGKLDLLEGVGGEVVAYYDSVDKLAEVDDSDALRSRAKALDILGSADLDKGNLDEAIRQFTSALGLRQRVYARLPDDHDVAWDLTTSYQFLGRAEMAKLQFDQAIAHMRAALAIHEAWMKRRPDDQTLSQIAFEHSYIGRCLTDLGKLADAEAAFRAEEKVSDEMIAHAPDNEAWQRVQSIALADLADVENKEGRQLDSLAHLRAARDLDVRRLAKHPDLPEERHDVAQVEIQISDLEQRVGQAADAAVDLRHAIDRMARLVEHDPTNLRWARDLTVAYQHLSMVNLVLGNTDEALVMARRDFDGSKRLAESDPANADWQQELAVAYNDVGNALLAKHDVAGALASYRAGVPLIDKIVAANPDDAARARDRIISDFLIARAEGEAGHRELALDAYKSAGRAIQHLLDRDPNNALNLLDLAQTAESSGNLELALGRRDDAVRDYRAALAVVERLAALDPKDDARNADIAEGSYKVASALGRDARTEALPLAKRALDILEDLAARKRIDADRAAMLPAIKKLVDELRP